MTDRPLILLVALQVARRRLSIGYRIFYPEVAVTLKRRRDLSGRAQRESTAARMGLEYIFVVGYSGNLGRAHEFATMLAAAERLNGNSNIVVSMLAAATC
jgi:hypothetical protein